jgi:hypothetical protein
VEQVLALAAVLDDAALSCLDVGKCGSLGEDRVREDGTDKVGGGRGSSVGGGDGALLETVQLEVGLAEILGDLGLESRSQVTLDKGADNGLGEPGREPLLVLGDGEVEVLEVDVNLLDGEEGLAVVLVGVLEGDVKRNTGRSELQSQHTRVLEWPEADLTVDPEGNVLGLEVEALDPETESSVILGSVCTM